MGHPDGALYQVCTGDTTLTYPEATQLRMTKIIFIKGHLSKLFGPGEIAFHDNLQDTYGSACKVYGLFGVSSSSSLFKLALTFVC